MRVGHLLLGLVLLVQTGPLCACAIDHALLCDDSHDFATECEIADSLRATAGPCADSLRATAGPCADPRCVGEDATCPRHHHGGACARRESSHPSGRPASQAGLPVLAVFRPLAVSVPAESFGRLSSRDASPDTPSDSTRSIPLLN
jgi:hypothetical protein